MRCDEVQGKYFWIIYTDKINIDILKEVPDELSKTKEWKSLLGLINLLTDSSNILVNNKIYVDILRFNALQKKDDHLFYTAVEAKLSHQHKTSYFNVCIPQNLLPKKHSYLINKTVEIEIERESPHNYLKAVNINILGNCEYDRQLLKWQIENIDLFNKQKKLPPKAITKIGLIVSPYSQARKDFENIFSKLHLQDYLKISIINETKETFVVNSIEYLSTKARCEIICIIRGGGSINDFRYLSHPDVLKAIDQCKSFIVTGIGHADNTTLADKLADYAAITPTDAAYYVAKLIKDIEFDNRLNELEAKVQQISELLDEKSISQLEILSNKLSIINQQIENLESHTVSDLIKKLSN